MGLRKLIGSGPTCLVPAETRGELNKQHYKNNGKGKNNSTGKKTSPGQPRAYGKKPAGKGKQGLTRFSENQFSDRKPKSKRP